MSTNCRLMWPVKLLSASTVSLTDLFQRSHCKMGQYKEGSVAKICENNIGEINELKTCGRGRIVLEFNENRQSGCWCVLSFALKTLREIHWKLGASFYATAQYNTTQLICPIPRATWPNSFNICVCGCMWDGNDGMRRVGLGTDVFVNIVRDGSHVWEGGVFGRWGLSCCCLN